MSEINVYGTGAFAVKFIINNPDIKVKCLIEGKKNISEFLSIPVLKAQYADCELRTRYTVVACSEPVYPEIKTMLETDFGLVEFENFEYWETYGKDIAIIYGNCHTLPIKEMLRSNRSFDEKYGFYPIPQIQRIGKTNKAMMSSRAFEKCSLFLHQCIRRENSYGEEYSSATYLKKISADCKVIGFPNLYGMPKFLYPQIDYTKNMILDGFATYHICDKYLDNHYKESSILELCNMINDFNLIPKHSILESMDMFFAKLSEREKEWDIKVGSFIKDNFRKKQLFYESYHPTNYFFHYVVAEILQLLGLETCNINQYVLPLDHDEIPIYGCITKTLELEYSVDYMRKYTRNTLNSYPLDLGEYIRQYIVWVHGENKI